MDPETTEERRMPHPPPTRLTPVGAAALIICGIVLLVPNAAWVGMVFVGWLQDRVGVGMVAVLSLPIALVLIAVLLIYAGATRARLSVSWLDRRTPEGADSSSEA